MSVFARSVRRRKSYSGSAILLSGISRLWRVGLVIALIWALTGWALQWW